MGFSVKKIPDSGTSLFLIIITLMSVAGLLATDIFLPAMSIIKSELGATQAEVQHLISIYLLSLALGQVFYGQLSDSYGRKKILILGVSIYTISSILCIFSHNISELLFLRFFQGLGACAGMVIGRAIIGDLFDSINAAKVFATFYPLITLFPALMPIIGGYITAHLGWRYTFAVTAVYGCILFLLVFFYLPETNINPSTKSGTLKESLALHCKVLFNPNFQFFSLIVCGAYAGYFIYIAGAPFLFSEMGYRPEQIGYFFIPLSVTYFLFNMICRRIVARIKMEKIIFYGILIFSLGSLMFLLQALIGTIHHPLQILIPISILTMGNGFLLPLGAAGVVATFSSEKGVASGLMGSLQLASAAFGSYLASAPATTVFPLGVFLSCIAVIMLMAYTTRKLLVA